MTKYTLDILVVLNEIKDIDEEWSPADIQQLKISSRNMISDDDIEEAKLMLEKTLVRMQKDYCQA